MDDALRASKGNSKVGVCVCVCVHGGRDLVWESSRRKKKKDSSA